MKVTLKSQKSQPITKDGDFKTLADVKKAFAKDGISFSNVKFVDRATKATYTYDDSKVPNVEELLLYVVPAKNKSGMGKTKKVVDIFEDAKTKISAIIDELKASGIPQEEVKAMVMGLTDEDMEAELKELK